MSNGTQELLTLQIISIFILDQTMFPIQAYAASNLKVFGNFFLALEQYERDTDHTPSSGTEN
jgi:hypothetical protein